MKKSLLFASALSLVMLAGCTKEQPAGNAPGTENKLNISGSIVTPDTRIQIGEPSDGKAPILWENGDEIMIFAANSQGIVPKTSWVWQPTMHSVQYGGIATATTGTPSKSTYFTCDAFNGDLTNDTYTLWGVYAADLMFSASRDTPVSTFAKLPDLSAQTYGKTNPYLMVASTPLEKDQTEANLQFHNTTAVLMLNMKGSAKIDKITVKQVNTTDDSSSAVLAYSNGMGGYANIDVTKAPLPGKTAEALADFIVLPTDEWSVPATPVSEVTVTTPNLQLSEEGINIPVGVLPFDLGADDALIVTVYGTSDDFETKGVECTLKPGETQITSNSIVYINLAPFNSTDFGQIPPKDDWAAGDVVFEDDFSWIMTAINWDSSDSQPDDPGFGGMQYTNLGGWASCYNGNLFPYYNSFGLRDGAKSFLEQRGYTTTALYDGLALYYENKGMISTGDEYGMSTTLSYQLSDLNNYKGKVTVSFKAARMTDASGAPNGIYGTPYPSELPISISGSGTIDGVTSMLLDATETTPFTFYEYTYVIDNADLTTVVTFGKQDDMMCTGAMYLDDLRITISEDSDVTNLTGTEVIKEAATLAYANPEKGHNFALPATGAEDATFTFKVTGPWKAICSEGISSNGSKPDGTTTWLKINSVQWSMSYSTPVISDSYGNLVPTVLKFSNIQDNTTGAERTATVTIVSPDDTTTYATYTFTQAAE